MKKKWTEEMDELLRRLYPEAHLANLAFRLGVSFYSMKTRARRLGLHRAKIRERWTDDDVDYLCLHYADMSTPEVAAALHHSVDSTFRKAHDLGLHKSLDYRRRAGAVCAQHPRSVATRFQKGRISENKGLRQEDYMSAASIERTKATRFQKGQRPHNARDVGSEVRHADGYIYVKTASGPMPKHRWLWEQHYGKVPKGSIVVFRDGDRGHCTIDNLELISRGENARRCISKESAEARRRRLEKASVSRAKGILRDKARIHFGLPPLGRLVSKW